MIGEDDMLVLKDKFIVVALILCFAFITTACGSPDEVEVTDEDTQAEALQVPEATTAPTPVPPTSTPQPSPTTALDVEIEEPNSPVTAPNNPSMGENRDLQPVPGSDEALAAAIADLAQQTGLPEDQIAPVSIEAAEWPDASLGCPEEGMMYAQVITPGFRIVLEAQGQQYEYHTDQNGNVVLCEQ
jgi:hypothetical protein